MRSEREILRTGFRGVTSVNEAVMGCDQSVRC